MNLVTGQDDVIIPWLAETFGIEVIVTPRVVLGIVDRDCVLQGAFVLYIHQERTFELAIVGKMSPNTARQLFRIVFGPLKAHRLEVRTSKRNKTIKKAAPKFGFKFEGVARDYYGPGESALVYAMTRDQCRWMQ